MPAYYRLSIEGTLGASPEVFSTSCAFAAIATLPSQSTLNVWADAAHSVMGGVNTGATWIRQNIGLTSSLQRVRLYYYPNVGDPATLGAVSSGASHAGAGTVVHPPQCATVVTLQTGLPGSTNRGRMYIPMLAGAIGSALTRSDISTSTASNFASLLVSLGGTASGGLSAGAAVVSTKSGAVTPVTSVRIGNVVDTQRRRRDSLIEQFYSAPLS